MNGLSALIQGANKEKWSSRQIAARAAELGHPVGHATIANYIAGRVPKRPSEDVLKALAAVFKIRLSRVREAADLSSSVTDISLPPEAARLTPRQWSAVREIIMSMVSPGDEGSLPNVTPIRPAPSGGSQERNEEAAAFEGAIEPPDDFG